MVGSDDNKLETVNIRLPDEILRLLDQLVEKGIFSNRSEAIREFAREYILEMGNAPSQTAQQQTTQQQATQQPAKRSARHG